MSTEAGAGEEGKTMGRDFIRYGELLSQIKERIRRAQVKAALSANAGMILMYWDIGRMIHERQQHEGWGAKVVPRLSQDIRNEFPEVKGFSKRNIGLSLLSEISCSQNNFATICGKNTS